MVVFYGVGTLIAIMIVYFLVATCISDGIIQYINSNLPIIVFIMIAIYIISLIIIFRVQKKDCGKIFWLTPLISLPSFIQFYYFAIKGVIGISKAHVLFSLCLLIAYIVWLIVSGFVTIVAQICCASLPIVMDKYKSLGNKALVLSIPLAIGAVGMFVNQMIF